MRRIALLCAAVLLIGADEADEQRRALADAKRQSAAALRHAYELEAQAVRARDAIARARIARGAVAARIQSAEADVIAADARVALVDAARRRQRARLAAEQAPVARLVGALQWVARRPPALALVQPGSIDDAIHLRAVLGGAVPAIRARTAGLRAELARAERLRGAAALAAGTLRDGQNRLRAERLRLVRLEGSERARNRQLLDRAQYEQDRAVALGEDARDIVDLLERLNDDAAVRTRLARLPGPVPRPAFGQAPAAFAGASGDDVRLPYRLPVVGEVVTGFGELSDAGVRARGLTLRTRAGALVVAPTGGRVAYAGRFKGYGRILILDHGRGYTSLLTGLDRLDVGVGDTVDRGTPIGVAPRAKPRITVELRREGRPVDITPLVS